MDRDWKWKKIQMLPEDDSYGVAGSGSDVGGRRFKLFHCWNWNWIRMLLEDDLDVVAGNGRGKSDGEFKKIWTLLQTLKDPDAVAG